MIPFPRGRAVKTLISVVVLVMLLVHSGIGQSDPPPEEKFQKALGLLSATGRTPADRNEAMKLLQSAGESGYAPAQTALGMVYSRDSVTTRDTPKAIEWLTRAADQDDWIAQLTLGRIYFTGDGVPQDSARAREWLSRAAATGDGIAAYYLGLLYDGRLGVTSDRAEAANWYRQSAETGNPYAQEKLANLLFKGLGVEKDPKEAYIWLLVAVEFGNSSAAIRLNSMENDLGTNVAKSAREKAADLRREILEKRSKNPCNGWPGQLEMRPVPPPLALLSECEKSAPEAGRSPKRRKF